jgi:hypothetical protein
VEYLVYLLIILAIMALCLAALRLPGRVRLAGRPIDLAERTRQRRERERRRAERDADRLQQHKEVIQRELQRTPVPWGWPGSDLRQHIPLDAVLDGGPGTLQRWIDQLVREKRTVDSTEYLRRRRASMRALLEDRFGRPVEPTLVQYEKVAPPRLRDPAEPYDQQDNFPSGRTRQIVSKLSAQPGSTNPKQLGIRPSVPLSEIRKPWGW